MSAPPTRDTSRPWMTRSFTVTPSTPHSPCPTCYRDTTAHASLDGRAVFTCHVTWTRPVRQAIEHASWVHRLTIGIESASQHSGRA